MHFSETETIEILIVLGCGDKSRTQLQVCHLFNDKIRVIKIEKKFHDHDHVSDLLKTGHPNIDEVHQLDIKIDRT